MKFALDVIDAVFQEPDSQLCPWYLRLSEPSVVSAYSARRMEQFGALIVWLTNRYILII